VILRGPMRPLAALAALVASLALQGCGNTCQDLGDRLCQCSGAGSARDNCKAEIKNQLNAAGVDSTDEAACSAALDTCSAPYGASFCEWVATTCGKAACGLSNESPTDPNVCAPP
jgi:hypothetical protein